MNIEKVLLRHHFQDRGYVLLPIDMVLPDYPSFVAFPKRGEDQFALIWWNDVPNVEVALTMARSIGARPLLFVWNSKERRGETSLIEV